MSNNNKVSHAGVHIVNLNGFITRVNTEIMEQEGII